MLFPPAYSRKREQMWEGDASDEDVGLCAGRWIVMYFYK